MRMFRHAVAPFAVGFAVLLLGPASAVCGDAPVAKAAPAQEADPETKAEVPELDTFHEVIYQLWHEAWPAKDTSAIKELLPQVEKDVAAVAAAKLPGILRDKQAAWDEGVKALQATLGEYRKAAGGSDDAALLAAVETIHSDFERLIRTIRPIMKELESYHVELYKIYHHYLPDRQIKELRTASGIMLIRAAALKDAEIPKKFQDKAEELNAMFEELTERTRVLRNTSSDGEDWVAIGAAVKDVHDQYRALEGVFDRPGH